MRSLYGFTSVQTYIFFDRYNDGRLLRSLVSRTGLHVLQRMMTAL